MLDLADRFDLKVIIIIIFILFFIIFIIIWNFGVPVGFSSPFFMEETFEMFQNV